MNKPFAPLSREEIAIRALGLRRDPLAGELIALEPRMVFDGAGVAIVADAAKQASDTTDTGQTDSTAKSAADLTKMMAAASVPPTPAAPAPVEVVFIDSRVSDIDAFKKTAGDNRLIVVVDAQDDGITKITDTLKGLHDISAVHIVGHGKSGAFELGKDWIGVDAIKAHDVDLRAWADSLSKGGDILLYGCDIAKDVAGENLLKAIAAETGADVTASVDAVGKTDHGADWSLEKKTGDIEAKVIAPDNYDAQLAEVVLVFIDKRVANYQAFANLATINGYNVIYFENSDDPFKVMDANFKTFSGITQVHLIAPGTTGGFVAGSALVDGNYIGVTTNTAFLKSWGQYFASGADFLIYGNKVAADANNQFIKLFKGYLGVAVDVAASADDVGVTNNTPDWTLEKSVVSGLNRITSNVLSPSGYAGTLAPGSFYGDPFTRFTYGGTYFSPWYEGLTTFTSTTTSLGGRVTDPAVLATLLTVGWSIVAYNTADNTETTLPNSLVNTTTGVFAFNPVYNYTPFSRSTTNAVTGSVNLGFFFRDSLGNRVDVKGSDGLPLTFTINMNAPAAAPIVGIFAKVDGSGNAYPVPVQAARNETIYDSSPYLIVSGDYLNSTTKVILKVNQAGTKTTYVYDNLTGTPTGQLVGKVSTRVDSKTNQIQTLFEIPKLSAGLSYSVECQIVDLMDVNGTQQQYGFSNNQASTSFTVDAGKPTFELRDSFGVAQTVLTMDSASDAFQTVDSVSIFGLASKDKTTNLLASVSYQNGTLNSDGTITWSSAQAIADRALNYGSNSSWNLNLLSTDLGGQGLKKVFVTVTDSSYAEGDARRTASHSTQVFLTSASTPGGLGGNGLTAWFDPKLSGISNSGSIKDLSGSNNSLSAGVDADGNSLGPTSVGGYLSFAAGQYMSLYSPLAPTSLFYVGDITGSASFYSSISNTGILGSSLGFLRNASDASTNPNVFSLSSGATTLLNNSATTGLSATSPYLASASFSGSNAAYSINGNAGSVTSSATAFSTGIRIIGAPSSATSSSIFGEFASYSTVLSAEQQAVLQNAAAQEYGLTIANDLFAPKASTSAYGADAAGLIRSSAALSATSVTNGALTVVNKTFLSSSAGSLFFGNDAASSTGAWKTGTDGVTQLSRTWALDIRGGATSNGTVDLTFDMVTLADANGVSVSTFINNLGTRNLALGFKSSETGAWVALGTASVDRTSGTVTFRDVKVGTNDLRTGFVSVLDATTMSYSNGAAAPASAYGTASFNSASVDVTFSNALGGTPSVSDFTVRGDDSATYGVTGVALKAGTTNTYTLTFSVDGTKAQNYTYSYKSTAPHTDAAGQKIVASVGSDGVSDGGVVYVDREAPPVLTVSKTGFPSSNGNDFFQRIGNNTLTITNGLQLNNTVDLSTDGGETWTRTSVSSTYGGSSTITMPEGKYALGQVKLRSIDVAGNRTIQTINPNGWFVVDLTAPIVTFGGFVSDAGTVQGTVNVVGGGTTLTDNTPVFFGNVDNNFFVSETDDPYKPTVTFRLSGSTITGTMLVGAPNSGSVAGTRKWTFTVTSPLANTSLITGGAQFSMEVTDAAGNAGLGAVSPPIKIAYVPPAPSFSLNSDTGSLNSDSVTKDNKINVSGVSSGSTWTWSSNGGVSFQTAYLSSSVTSFNLTDGVYAAGKIQIKQKDSSGLESTVFSNSSAITIDTIRPFGPPAVSFPGSVTEFTGSNAVTIHDTSGTFVVNNITAAGKDGFVRYSSDGTTNWKISTDGVFTLNEGFYAQGKIKLQFVDLAGNEDSIVDLAYNVTISSAPPDAPVLTLPADVGVSTTDGITKNKTVTVSALPSSQATYWEYSTNGVDFTKGSGTSFDLDVGLYAAGQIQVRQVNYGLVSAISSNSAALTIDTSAPEVTWVADKTSLKAGETTSITFTASEAIDGLTATNFTVSGGTLSAFTQSSTNAKVYTATFSPATNFNGTATVTLTGNYTDIAGNDGTLKTPVSLSVDTTAPSLSSLAITATGGQNNYLNAGDIVTVTATFTQSVTVSGTPRVALNIGGVTRYATYKSGDGTTGLTFTYTIASGDTDLNGISIDANKLELNGATLIGSSGNNVVLDHAAVSDNAALMVDTAAPTITISSSQPALKIGETATITFTVSESVLGLDASNFSVSNGALSNFARVGTRNDYTATFTPSSSFEGTGNITFKGSYTDLAGNDGAPPASALSMSVDTKAPTTPSISSVNDNLDPVHGDLANNGYTNDTTPTLTISAEAGSIVKVYDGTNLLGTATETSTAGTYTFTTANLLSGSHSFTVKASDAAGNESGASTAFALTIDTSAPATPTITSVSDNVDPVPGPVANNGFTNDTTPTLTISAEAGSVVKIYDGTTLLGTATETSTAGTFTFTTPNLLSGSHSFTVKASDAAGNESGASTAFTLTIDTSAPATPTITSVSDNVDPVSGPIANNGFTNDTTPTLTISAEAGSVVKVYDGTTLLGTATETSTAGIFTFTPSALTADIHTFTVTATDAGGNVSAASASHAITIDTTKPDRPANLQLATDSGVKGDSVTNAANVTLNAELNSDVTVTYFNATTNKTVVVAPKTRVRSADPLFIAPSLQDLLDLGDGEITVTAIAVDAAGNASGSATLSFTLDRTAPTLALSSPAASLKAGEVATITLTLSEAVTGLDVSDFDVTNGTLGALVQSTTDPKVYTATFTPKDKFFGPAKISFKSTGAYADIAGNVGDAQSVTSGALTFNVDTTAASITTVAVTSASGAQNNYLNQGDTAFVTVTFSEAVTVNATNGRPQLALKIGNVTRYATFDSGSGSSKLVFKYQVDVSDTDMNGISLDANSLSLNGGSISTQATGNPVVLAHADVADNASYMVDTTKPDAPVLSRGAGVADGATSDEATATGGVVTLSAELGASVEVKFSNGAKSVTKTITGIGLTPVAVTLSADELKTLGDGTISVSANATDLAGNISDAGDISFTLDTTKPGKPVLTPVPGVEDGATAEEAKRDKGVVTVTADPDTDVTVTFRNGNKEITKTVRGGGTRSVPVILTQADLDALGDGTISVSAVSKDAAGNESDAGTSRFTLDTVAPTISVTSSAAALKVGETATLTFEASEELVDLTADDFAVAHGTLSNFVRSSSNPKIYTATFTPDTGFEGQGGVTLKGAFTDKAGNSGSLSSFAGISIDTKPPEVSLVSYDDNVDPQAGNFAVNVPTNDLTPTFNGTGESGAKVEVFRRSGSALVSLGTTTVVNGKWSVTPGTELAEGSYDIFARITDNAGNISDTANNTLTIDRGTSGTFDGYIDNTVSPPVVADFATPASATQLSFAGKGEADATVDLFVRDSKGDTKIGTAKVDPATGKWTLRPTNELVENTYTIFVRVTDKAGNSFDTPTKSLTIAIPRVSSAPAEAPVIEPTKPASPTTETSSADKVTDNFVQASFGPPIGSLFDVKTIQSVVVTQDARPMPRDVTGSVGDEGSVRSQLPAVEYSSYLRPAFVEIGVLVRDTRSGFVAARSEMLQVDEVKVTSRAEFEPWIEDTKTGRILVRRDGPAEIRMQVEITLWDGAVIRQNIRVDSRSGQFEVLPSGNTFVAPQSLDQQLASVLWGDMRDVSDLFEEAQL